MRTLTEFVLEFTILLCIGGAVVAAPHGGWDAAWSPDGAWIAFTAGSPHGIPNLWLVRPDGASARQMTVRGAHAPRWMPDGRSIVFGTVRGGRPAFMSIESDGQPESERPVAALPPGSEDPVWSPDGSLVAFAVPSADGSARDLWFARSAGGGSSGLTSKFWVREWTWSPDGGTLAFVVGRAAGSSIWLATLQNKDVRLLYKGFCKAPSYSPDGKRLAIAVPDPRSGFKIVVIHLATGRDKRIGVMTFGGEKIIWSPDGSRLYFTSSKKSEPAVWTVESGGRNVRRLTPEGTACGAPALSPDGTMFALQAMQDSSYSPELFVCKSSGEGLTRLTRSSPSYYSPAWSPDSNMLAYQSDKEHLNGLFVGSTSGRAGRPLAQVFDADFAEVVWFADGAKLVVADAGGLYTVRTAGGKDSLKAISAPGSGVQSLSFAGDEVYFAESRGWNAGVSAVKTDGSAKRMLTNKPPDKPATKEQPSPEKVEKGEPSPTPATREGAGPGDGRGSDPAGEEGNPHSGLGLMGPIKDLNAGKAVPAVIDLLPAVSPDGKTVAFVRNGQVWLIGSDGQNERQLTHFPDAEGEMKPKALGLSWAPSGSALLFTTSESSDDALTIRIWSLAPDKGAEQPVYSEKAGSEYGFFHEGCTSPPRFTPDGERIVFTSVSGSRPRIVSIDTTGGDPRELAPAPSTFAVVDASGKRLAYVDLSNDLERIRVVDPQSGKRTGPLFK